MSTTVTVPQLSLDIIRKILQHVAVESRNLVPTASDELQVRQAAFHDLGSCALVSRDARDVILPIQWHSLALTLRGSSRTSTRKTLRAIIVFLEQHPNLSQHVRALALCAEDTSCPDIPASELAELLSHLPNIQDLHFTNLFINFNSAFHSGLTFPALEQLSCNLTQVMIKVPVRVPNRLWTPLYLFPEIGQFVLRRAISEVQNQERFPEKVLTPRSVRCRVRSLVLDAGDAGEVFLNRLLLDLEPVYQANSLHTLELHYVCLADLPTRVVPAIQRVSSTLKRLSLGLIEVIRSDYGTMTKGLDDIVDFDAGCLTILRDLPSLEEISLCIGAHVLRTFTPTGLWSLLRHIFNFLVDLPKLRIIRVEVLGCDTFFTSFFDCSEGLQRCIQALLSRHIAPKTLEMVSLGCTAAEDLKGDVMKRLRDEEYEALYSIFPDLIVSGVGRVGFDPAEREVRRMKEKYVELSRKVDGGL